MRGLIRFVFAACLVAVLASPAPAEDAAISIKAADAFWTQLEKGGPGFSTPDKVAFAEKPIAGRTGNLYAALFPRKDFGHLWQFHLFLRYASSLHQEQIRSIALGRAVDMSWFVPNSRQTGLEGLPGSLQSWAELRDLTEIKSELSDLGLPASFRWVLTLAYEDALFAGKQGAIELEAKTKQGYLSLFLVDD